MTFKPGQSGNPGGRRKPFLKRPDEELHEKGLSPIQEILKLIPNLPERDQLKAWLELLSYCHAKPKEISADDPLAGLTMEQLIAKANEVLPELLKKVG